MTTLTRDKLTHVNQLVHEIERLQLRVELHTESNSNVVDISLDDTVLYVDRDLYIRMLNDQIARTKDTLLTLGVAY